MTSYMGIAVFSIDLNYERDVFVIGMKEVYGKHNSEKLKETIEDFWNTLIDCIKKRFQYEFKSNIYKVASLFKISRLAFWLKRSFSKQILLNSKQNIKDVYEIFLTKSNVDANSSQGSNDSLSSIPDNQLSSAQCQNMFKRFGKLYFVKINMIIHFIFLFQKLNPILMLISKILWRMKSKTKN